MGTLAAGIAHEINNPLAYVLGNLELLNQMEPDESARECLDDIAEGVARIRSIVASLKLVSRAEEHRRAEVDLNEIARASIRLVASEVHRRCQLECHWAATPATVLGDEGRLAQVLINLLLNASQAFSSGNPSTNRVDLTIWMSPLQAGFDVCDNGPGVPPEIVSKIFDPFFTTKPVGSGTGLGLSICQGIIRSMDGNLEHIARPEGGACFRVSIPRANLANPADSLATRNTVEGRPNACL